MLDFENSFLSIYFMVPNYNLEISIPSWEQYFSWLKLLLFINKVPVVFISQYKPQIPNSHIKETY